MKKIILLGCTLFLSTVLFAQQREKEAAVKELMTLTGAGNMGVQFAQVLMVNLKKQHPEVSEQFWDRISQGFNADSIENIFMPIYTKYFELDEIRQIIAFYKTPVGVKLIKETPLIMKESAEAGEAWGEQMGRRIVQQMETEKKLQEQSQNQ